MPRISPAAEIELTRTQRWLEQAKALAREDTLAHFGSGVHHPDALPVGTDPLDARRYFEARVDVRFNELKAAAHRNEAA